MTGAVPRYRDVLRDLLQRRASAGGELPDEEEDRFMSVLDRLWYAMSADERSEAARIVAAERAVQ